MDLMQLEMFVAMVEEGSFRKAAERVFRTQPAVSMALRKLEQEIGTPIFDRSTRSDYELTDTGEVLYDYAKQLLNLRDEAYATLKQLQSLQSGRIRIGANESTSLYLLPGLILAFREQYPKIKIEVLRQLSTRLPAELRQRNLDVAIMSFKPNDSDLEATPIMRDELALISSPGHRLAKSERVHIKDLGAESFIAHNVRSSSRDSVIESFRKHETPLNISIEIATIETIKKFVSMNLGLAFVPRMCVQEEVERGEIVLIPLQGFSYARTLWVVRRRTETHSHAASAFLQLISEFSSQSIGNQPAIESASDPALEAIN